MNAIDKKLLLRMALRMERAARETYEAAIASGKTTPSVEQARRTRDRELGDVSDLKEYVRTAEFDSVDAARFRFLASEQGAAYLGRSGPLFERIPFELARDVDAAMARAPAAKLGSEG